jgi:chromosome partitioning protein
MVKIIAVALPKGGVGKTTTALNISIAFSLSKKKTLLIDMDPSGSCASSLGLKRKDVKNDIFDVLQFSSSLQRAIHKTEYPFLDFVPIKAMNYIDEVRLGKILNNEQLLGNILRPEAFSYDFVIIDCPPYLVGTTNLALMAADSVIIPITPGQYALNAVNKIMDRLKTIRKSYNRKLKIEGILLTIYEYNTKVSFATKKALFNKYPSLVFNTSIPKNAKVGEATIHNKPVIIYDPSSKASKAYVKLSREIIESKGIYSLSSQLD